MRTTRIYLVLIALFTAGSFGFAVPCVAQQSSLPELAVLGNYIGKWDTTMAATSGAGKETEMKAEMTAKWILDGRYVQQTATVEDVAGSEALSLTTLMTFDSAAGVYRSWSFTSAGTTSEGKGTWDEESKTMTWSGEDGKADTSTTITATFVKDGEEHWSIATEDSAGKMVSLITGKNKRRGK